MKSEIVYSNEIKNPLPGFAGKPFGKFGSTGPIALLCIALVVIILAVYVQVGNHQFLNFDDNTYVTGNPHVAGGLTGRNVIRAFTSVDAANWHPVTWLSHMADVELFGMNPRGHHLTSVAIHTLSALLLFLLLTRLTAALWQSLFVAALFALHPLHVESVAWVAERKDVLSAFFWFLTLFFYSAYVAKQKPASYVLALSSFMLGLMSKPMLVTLPMVMMMMDYWPLGRYQCGDGQRTGQPVARVIALAKEKIPFFLLSLLSGLVTIYAQKEGGSIAALTVVSFRLRIENALIAYVKYIGKTAAPHDLAIYYPFPLAIPLWQVISSLAVLLFLSAAAIRVARRHPYFAVGWFWFLVTLVPVIGFIQVGAQSMADRYSYIPMTGLCIMAAWGVPELVKGLRHRQAILALLAGTVITASAALTWQQLGNWRDNISLFRQTLRVTTDNSIIHDNLGAALFEKGDTDAAIQEYWKAIRINPNNKNTHYNLGLALQTKGDLNTAIQEYRMSLLIYHNDPDVHNNLGLALAGIGELDGAVHEYREALRINPDDSKTHSNLGAALAGKGELDAAIREFKEALRINPNSTNANNNLRMVFAQKWMLENKRK